MYFCRGELAEWSIAVVLKTIEGNLRGFESLTLRQKKPVKRKFYGLFCFLRKTEALLQGFRESKKATVRPSGRAFLRPPQQGMCSAAKQSLTLKTKISSIPSFASSFS